MSHEWFILSMEGTLKASQEEFIPIRFVKISMVGILKKKKVFITCLCRDIHKICFPGYLSFQNLVSRSPQSTGLIRHLQEKLTTVLCKVRHIFCLKECQKLYGL